MMDQSPSLDSSRKTAVLAWTPELLRHFLSSFLLPLYHRQDQPFGPISIRLSGPKPDPFIALNPPQPLMTHQRLPHGKEGMTPMRVETGDHIRVYCDAKCILSIRTWFHGVEVDRAAVKAGEGTLKLFNKIRLVLVGERGEALIVA